MKRSRALVRLSRDHHQALVAAQRLRRATADTASDTRTAFLDFWCRDGAPHFRAEEDVLLPAMAAHVDHDHPAIVRVLAEHVDIRRRARELEATAAPPVDDLHALGERLRDHVRHEERVLFMLAEETIPEPELDALVDELEQAQS